MSGSGYAQGKAKVTQYTSASSAAAFTDPTKYPDWVQIVGAGSTVITCEDGTNTTFTTDAAEPMACIAGPFTGFVSTSATRVRLGNGPMPQMAYAAAAALPAASLGPHAAISVANQATLSGLAQTVDGVALSTAGMRVYLAKQTTGAQNGSWVVAAGNWTRPSDWASGATIPVGTQIQIAPGGTANFIAFGGTWYTDSGVLVDTDTIVAYPRTVRGAGTLVTGTPSAVTVSSLWIKHATQTSIACTNETTAANGVKAVLVAGAGTGTLVITGPNSVTDVISYTATNG